MREAGLFVFRFHELETVPGKVVAAHRNCHNQQRARARPLIFKKKSKEFEKKKRNAHRTSIVVCEAAAAFAL